MSDSFDAETLRLLDETKEVRIETRRDEGSAGRATIIWVVVVDGGVYVRSVQGEDGRWYRRITSNPNAALHVDDRRIPVRAALANDDETIEAVSEAYRSKYGRTSPGSTGAMVRDEVLHTTLRLEPA